MDNGGKCGPEKKPGKPFLRMKIKTFRQRKLLTSGGANSE
jgi:hypothetical protein